MNVRTEIAYGLARDGCTAIFWKRDNSSFLAQNWDWQEEQEKNLISLNISQKGKPAISMITEAGIIGKIGLNSRGVGVCLNAIKAPGVDFQRLPCHLALRTCLESTSTEEAVVALAKAGVASACHILVRTFRRDFFPFWAQSLCHTAWCGSTRVLLVVKPVSQLRIRA